MAILGTLSGFGTERRIAAFATAAARLLRAYAMQMEVLRRLQHRFPPPWTVEEHNDACFIVKDATAQAFAYFYFEGEPVGA